MIPRSGQFWVVKRHGQYIVARMEKTVERTWTLCGDDIPVTDVEPVSSIRLERYRYRK